MTFWRSIGIVLTVALGPFAVSAQTLVSVRDARGAELRKIPAVTVAHGYLIVSRSGLQGAASADTVTTRISHLAAEDADADVALLAAPGVRDISRFVADDIRPEVTLAGSGFAAYVESQRDVPGFGALYPLKTEKNHPLLGSPLWNSKGEVSAWLVSKTIDGQRFSFAIPVHRLLCLSPRVVLKLPAWSARQKDAAMASFALAMGYFWVQDFDGASYHFREATRHDSEDSRAWFYLAFSEGKMGRTRQKIAAYQRAVILRPEWDEAHFNLGFGHLLNGDRTKAEQQAEILAGLNPFLAERLENFMRVIHIDPLPSTLPASHPKQHLVAPQ